jgi:ribosome silencing factor RsfS/YbeB/iojap
MATTRTKTTVKKSVKKSTPVKTAPKKAAAQKTVVKKAVVKKPAVKKAVVKKAAVKKAVVKKAVVKKAAAKKAVAKKAVVKKAAVKKVVAKKSVVKKVVTKPVPQPSAPTPVVPPVSMKGLRVSGAKAARIAQIVAESFLNKATEPKLDTTQPAAPAPKASGSASKPSAGSASVEPGSALDAAHKAAAVLFSKKAEEVVLMDLRNLSTVADYYLIATCTNEPQMRAILGTVQRSLSRDGIKSLRSEYMPGVRWAVIDYGDLIVHLFEKQTRGFYSLERLWADAPATALKASDYQLTADEDGLEVDEDGDL